MSTSLRSVDPIDIPGLATVFLRCWRQSYSSFLPEAVIAYYSDARGIELWQQALAEPNRQGWVLEEEGIIVGFCLYSPATDSDEGWVDSLYVDPAATGQGYGSRLLDAATTSLATSAQTAHLWVFARNARALGIYLRQGWTPDGVSRVEEQYGELELRLTKPLTSATAEEMPTLVAHPDTIEQGLPNLLAGPSAPAGALLAINRIGQRAAKWDGSADTAGTPLSGTMAFDLASVTKVIATTCLLMRLNTLRQIDLDNPLSHYLPDSGAAGSATLRQLLTHRAGLWEWQPLYLAGPDPWQTLAELPLRYAIDSGRHYSDLGFIWLGRVIEVVTASRLDQALRDLITGPLRLRHTTFGPIPWPAVTSARSDQVEQDMVATADPYPILFPDQGFAWRQGEIRGQAADGNAYHAFGGVAGHAGLFSTCDDLLSLLAALADDSGPLAIVDGPRSRTADQFFSDGPDQGQALGWRTARLRLDQNYQHFVYHPGFTGCAVGLWPGSGTALVMLTNRLLAAQPVKTMELFARSFGVEIES